MCAVIYKNQMLLFASGCSLFFFVIGKTLIQQFVMFILHLIINAWWAVVPRKCRDVGIWVAWGNTLLFASQTENFTILFCGHSFWFPSQNCRICDAVIRNCPCKTKRPPLVPGHHWSPASRIHELLIQMLTLWITTIHRIVHEYLYLYTTGILDVVSTFYARLGPNMKNHRHVMLLENVSHGHCAREKIIKNVFKAHA